MTQSGARPRRWAARLGAVVAVWTLLGCPPPPPRTVSLRMTGNIPDASVTIDDEYVGALAYVARRGVALPPGTHRITVKKLGYFPWDGLVEAKGEGPIRLEVTLEPVPD